MAVITRIAKRLVIGRPVRSDRVGHTLLPKKLALPIFASDALSSVAYATQEILLVLTLAGTAYLYLAPWLAAAVVVLLLTVVASYRQLVLAYPTGGGDYEVATKNLGRPAGVIVASALLVDYVMTVAVSVSSGVDNIISAVPSLNDHRVLIALSGVVILMAVNLRGVREAGAAFALPTYAFAISVGLMIVTGIFRAVVGDAPVAESAKYGIEPHHGYGSLTFFALLFFALRAFSSGCTALTGVEAIANGVPAFQKPKAKNAQKTLVMMGGLAAGMFAGITVLAVIAKVRVVDAKDTCALIGYANCETEPQRTVIAQLAAAVFGGHNSFGFFFIQAATALILILAANTAFNGFPLLGSILAQDRNLPRQLHTRGDRLVYSNGVIALAVVAGFMIFVYSADVTRLIQLYIVGVFTSFTLGQTGMVPALEPHPAHRARSGRATADPAFTRDQRVRRVVDGRCSGHRDRDQVHPRRLPGAHRDADPVPDHAGDLQALLAGQPGAGQRRSRPDAACPQPRGRARVEAAQADPAGARLRASDPAGHPDRIDGQRRRRGHPFLAGRLGQAGPAGEAHCAGVALP